jgi:hypothetical protein
MPPKGPLNRQTGFDGQPSLSYKLTPTQEFQMRSRTARSVLSLSLLTLAAGLVGCSTVDGDHSPEMLTLHQRPVDYYNARGLTIDQNNRMLWNDWQRLTLFDRPSRLTPAATAH